MKNPNPPFECFPVEHETGVDPPPPMTTFTVDEMKDAIQGITPSLILLGIVGGAAFAIGSGLVSKYLFKGKR